MTRVSLSFEMCSKYFIFDRALPYLWWKTDPWPKLLPLAQTSQGAFSCGTTQFRFWSGCTSPTRAKTSWLDSPSLACTRWRTATRAAWVCSQRPLSVAAEPRKDGRPFSGCMLQSELFWKQPATSRARKRPSFSFFWRTAQRLEGPIGSDSLQWMS